MRKFFYLLIAALALAACNENEPTVDNTGALKGKFSVSADKQIRFSQGNLQYRASDQLWRFAESQLDFLGKGNENISDTYDGFIDLFGWGTGENPTKTSTTNAGYGTFTDWGTNAISNGGNHANLWRTLTREEWLFILHGRPNADKLVALATVNSQRGLILLPDNWNLPKGLTLFSVTEKGFSWDSANERYEINDDVNHFKENIYTRDEWEKLEAAGAVYFPIAGGRYETTVGEIGNQGLYWSATSADAQKAVMFAVSIKNVWITDNNRFFGYSVRLVYDVKAID